MIVEPMHAAERVVGPQPCGETPIPDQRDQGQFLAIVRHGRWLDRENVAVAGGSEGDRVQRRWHGRRVGRWLAIESSNLLILASGHLGVR